MIALLSDRWRSQWALFLAIVLVGCAMRLGYGVVRYHDSLSRTGSDFISLWDFDALEHVLIARSLIEENAYRVGPLDPEFAEKNIRFGAHDAVYKAPLYQYFLAAAFALSGFSFALFFPVQALIGGIAGGLAALVALELFRDWRIAAFSGMAAAVHPVLVNAASQPYNENLFMALLFGSLWAFVRWLTVPRLRWALGSGVLGGLAILCRETAGPLLVTMAGFALVTRPAGARRSIAAASAMIGVATLIVVPWSVRNFVRTGTVIPVASIAGTALAMGNNECLAGEPLLGWYWAEGPCTSLNMTRQQLLDRYPPEEWDDRAIRNRINAGLAAQFIAGRPVDYLKLCLKRAWTVFLPFHPRQGVGGIQRVVLSVYWLALVPAGLLGIIVCGRTARGPWILLALLIGAILLPQVLIYFSPDMRYRIFADLLLACCAGSVYAGALRRTRTTRAPMVAES